MYFEIYQDASGLLGLAIGSNQWRWRLKGANREIVASGEGYASKQSCVHAINLLKSTGPTTPIIGD